MIRLIIQSARGSVVWASRNHKLPSEKSEHYDDKNQYSHSITNAKYVADPEAISGMTVVKVPEKSTSTHSLPSRKYSSTYSLDYAAPQLFPQVATFTQDLNAGPLRSQFQTSLAHLNGESSAAIELETRSSLNSQEPTTTTVAIDSSRRLSNEAQMLGQTEELSMLVGEQGIITRSVVVSHPSNVSEGYEFQKSRSLHVRGSEALLLLPQLPSAATMKGFCSPAVAISTLSDDVSPSLSLSSLKSPRSPRLPTFLKPIRNRRAAHLRLNVSLSPYIFSKPPSRSTTLTIHSAPLQPLFISTPTSPFTPASFYSSSSWSSNSMPGSPSSYGGGYSNTPVDRKLPTGFASSPVAKTTERFE